MKRPLNRSYLNGRVRPWTMKHRLSDFMRVLRRSVELATESGRSWAELWSAIFDPTQTSRIFVLMSYPYWKQTLNFSRFSALFIQQTYLINTLLTCGS